jgi:phosphoribosyl 1,2-cyclic phosphate phosphodiesterase
MHLTFLGTGSVHAAPVPGCGCTICRVTPAPARRKPCSGLIEANGTRLLIDAGGHDLLDRFNDTPPDAVLLTHFHPDHVQGLFPWRWAKLPERPAFHPPDPEGCADLYRNPGFLRFCALVAFAELDIGACTITPLPLAHSKPTFGYGIEHDGQRLAWLTDTVGLPEPTRTWLAAWRPHTVVVDCSYPPGFANARNHNTLDQAVAIISECGAEHGWLTHLGHEVEAWLADHAATMPGHVRVALDGHRISS